MRNTGLILLMLGAGLVMLGGCKTTKPDYDRPLGAGEQALRKLTDPCEIPDFTWGCYNVVGLSKSIDNSLHYLSKPSSERFYPSGPIGHADAVASLKAFKGLLDAGLTGATLNQAIREKFDVYMSVGCDDEGTVLFTGYYTPILEGSMAPTEKFRYPLYNQPEDLVKGPDGEILGQKGADGQIRPYPSRKEIMSSGMLAGKELVWLKDEFEAYVAHVQGSAKIRMPGGELKTMGYAANNGHEYQGIAAALVEDGQIEEDKISLSSMIAYFQAHPEKVGEYTGRNPRFVFFQADDGPPRGSLNEPVTAMRSIATDKSIFPRGCLGFISTRLPGLRGEEVQMRSYRGFVLDQDTGGAIRAPGRCDVYMGVGARAGEMAGQTYEEGKLYYLFLREESGK